MQLSNKILQKLNVPKLSKFGMGGKFLIYHERVFIHVVSSYINLLQQKKAFIQKKKNSTPTGLNGLGNQHDGPDVMWKRSLRET